MDWCSRCQRDRDYEPPEFSGSWLSAGAYRWRGRDETEPFFVHWTQVGYPHPIGFVEDTASFLEYRARMRESEQKRARALAEQEARDAARPSNRVKQYVCPTCRASAGEGCRTATGLVTPAHMTRKTIMAAAEQDAANPPKSVPAKPAPDDPAPVVSTLTDPTPTDPTPTEAFPTDPVSAIPAPAQTNSRAGREAARTPGEASTPSALDRGPCPTADDPVREAAVRAAEALAAREANRFRNRVKRHPCPARDASTGEACVTSGGRPTSPHGPRKALMRAAESTG